MWKEIFPPKKNGTEEMRQLTHMACRRTTHLRKKNKIQSAREGEKNLPKIAEATL